MAIRPVLDVIRVAAPGSALTVVALQVASGICTALALFATTGALEGLLATGPTADRVVAALPGLALVTAAYLAKGGCDAGVALARARLVPRVRRIAEERLIDAALHARLSAFDEAQFYERMHRARDRGLLHVELTGDRVIELIGALFAVLAAAGTLGVLHPALLPVLALCVIPEGWAVLRSARLEYAGLTRTATLQRRVWMIEDLSTKREAAAEIRASQAEPFVLDEFRQVADTLQEHDVGVGLAQAKARTLGRAMAGLGMVVTFAALGLLLHAGWIPLAIGGTAVLAIRAGSAALTRLVVVSNQLLEHGLYVADYQAFLTEAAAQALPATGRRAPTAPERIELRGVGFRYPGGSSDTWAVHGIDLTIHSGQTIALVGENGSGKTTLAMLIAGLYRPTEGCITWDGTDITRFDPASLTDRIVTVLQDPVRWPNTARANVRVGRHDRRDPGEVMLRAAAARSGADDIIDGLPRQWDTLLSKYFRGGRELSGGQWQRLAIARGLFRDAPLLIWDEPTAPLDAKAEYAVYESLRQMAGGRTVILITHRLASVRHADRIYLLHRGALAEQGTHPELLAAGGHYAQLYGLQARLYGALTEEVTG